MPNHKENLSVAAKECSRLIPEKNNHIDQRLTAVINMTLDNCDHQLSLHQPDLVAIGNPKTFSGYLNLLRSAINNPDSPNGESTYLVSEKPDSRRNVYSVKFISQKDAKTQNDFLHPINQCHLVVSPKESGFNIKYSLLASESSIHMSQQLATISIDLQPNGNSNISLRLYSNTGCFKSESLAIRNKTESSPGIKAYHYISTHLNLQ